MPTTELIRTRLSPTLCVCVSVSVCVSESHSILCVCVQLFCVCVCVCVCQSFWFSKQTNGQWKEELIPTRGFILAGTLVRQDFGVGFETVQGRNGDMVAMTHAALMILR
jgi:hypothetical protein